MNNKFLKTLLPILVLVALLFAQKYLNRETPSEEAPVTEETVSSNEFNAAQASLPAEELGDEAPVVADSKGTILVEHEGFSLLYDTKTMCPLWVAWELTAAETRGKANICPQNAELNKVWWEHLERACRDWARKDGSVQIVCGPVFPENPKHFGKKHRMAVPKGFYKVVLSLKKGKEKAIGFYYTNDNAPQPMEDAVRSVDEIEHMTGFDFFSSLPDSQEDRLEAMTDLRAWDK